MNIISEAHDAVLFCYKLFVCTHNGGFLLHNYQHKLSVQACSDILILHGCDVIIRDVNNSPCPMYICFYFIQIANLCHFSGLKNGGSIKTQNSCGWERQIL